MHGKGILYNIFDKTKTTGNWFNGKMISKDEEQIINLYFKLYCLYITKKIS